MDRASTYSALYRAVVLTAAVALGLTLLATTSWFTGARPSLAEQPSDILESDVLESEIVPADEAAAISGLALVNVGTGTCVTLEGPRQEQPGEQLITQQNCVGSPEQTWMFDDQGRLRNSTELDDLVESCVTMPDLDAQPVVVTQMVCDGSDRQAWLAQALGDGTFVIQSVSDPALCIDGFSQDGVTLTATPCQTESGGTPGQAFDLVSLDTPTGEALIADDPAVADAAVDIAAEDPFADGPLSDEPSTEEMLLDGPPVEETPVDAAISGNSFVTLADLEGRVDQDPRSRAWSPGTTRSKRRTAAHTIGRRLLALP